MSFLPSESSPSPLRLSGRRLSAARLVWLILLLLTVGKVAIGLPLYYAEVNSVCVDSQKVCNQGDSLTPQQVRVLESNGLPLSAYARIDLAWKMVTSLTWAGIGIIIFLLRPNEMLALIASAMMLVQSASYEAQIRSAYPYLGTVAELTFNLGNILMFLFIGLFPSGRFSPRWMRWYWLGMILFSILPLDVWLPNLEIYNVVLVIYWITFLILGPYSQIYRYRNESNSIERQQTKWVVMGFAVFAGALLIGFILFSIFPEIRLGQILYQTFIFDLGGLLIPLGIGFSVLRYRLWDIDLVIRRTLQYSLVTGLLGLVFFGAVTLLQGIFSSASGEQSTISIVISTLAIAALFNPLRRRVQDFIDRRFYRQKYDAEKALAEFADAARSETEMDALRSRLVAVIRDTMQPDSVSLWLKQPSSPIRGNRSMIN